MVMEVIGIAFYPISMYEIDVCRHRVRVAGYRTFTIKQILNKNIYIRVEHFFSL